MKEISVREKQQHRKKMKFGVKMFSIAERLREPKGEEGGGLLSLLGISTVVLIMSLSIAGAATFGTILTHKDLASKQAMDSADSGISEAFFKLSNGSCEATGSDETLNYSYQIYHSEELIAPSTIDSPGLVAGCPTDLDRWVLIEAEGAGKNNTDKKSVITAKWVGSEARVIPQVVTGGQINLTSTEVLGSASGVKVRPTVYSKSGGVSCVDVSPKMKNINISVDSPVAPVDCSIVGDIRATSDVDLNSAVVNGDVCSTEFIYNSSGVAGQQLENAMDCKTTGTMYGYKPNYTSNTINLAADDCANFVKFKEIVETIHAEPTILNASSCAAEFTNMMSTPDAKILDIGSNDLTVVVDEDTIIRDLTVKTSQGPSSFSFVIPSGISDSTQSSCLLPASLNLENVVYEEGVSGLFYSPCSVNLIGSDISGQVYGGNSVLIEDTSMRYYPIELTNADSIVGDGSLPKNLVRVL